MRAWACTPLATSTRGQPEPSGPSRDRVLAAAYATHPERFARKPPAPPDLPATFWINPPQEKEAAAQ